MYTYIYITIKCHEYAIYMPNASLVSWMPPTSKHPSSRFQGLTQAQMVALREKFDLDGDQTLGLEPWTPWNGTSFLGEKKSGTGNSWDIHGIYIYIWHINGILPSGKLTFCYGKSGDINSWILMGYIWKLLMGFNRILMGFNEIQWDINGILMGYIYIYIWDINLGILLWNIIINWEY